MKYLNLLLLIALAALQYRLWSGNGSLPEVWRLEGIEAAQMEENKGLEERNQALAAEVMDLKDGMDAVEERARSEMGMIARGETFYQIIETPHPPGRGPRSP